MSEPNNNIHSSSPMNSEELNQLVNAIEKQFGIKHVEPKLDELGRIIINDQNQIPKNMTEIEEVNFWNKHAMSEELLEASFLDDDDELPPPRRESKSTVASTKPINLRIETDLLQRLQKIAQIKEMPYQTLLKQFVAERLYEEEKREKVF
jgi:predicted DNA binding CopG/RHH family protein